MASIPVPESSGNVSLRMDGGEKSIDASFVPTSDLLGVSGAEKLKDENKNYFSFLFVKPINRQYYHQNNILLSKLQSGTEVKYCFGTKLSFF